MGSKKTSDYLSIRIRVFFPLFHFLFIRFISYLSFRIVKFVFTVIAIIFWPLSLSNNNMNTIAFWTNFNKIPRYLKKFIIRSFNKFTIPSSQKLISDSGYCYYPYKGICIGGFSIIENKLLYIFLIWLILKKPHFLRKKIHLKHQ